MVREIRKSSKVREKSGNFKIMFCSKPSKIEQTEGIMKVIIIIIQS